MKASERYLAEQRARRQRSIRDVEQHMTDRRSINRTHSESDETISVGQRAADAIARFGGSWSFIIVFFAVLIGWVTLNTWFLLTRPFDPYPFILLNLVLSMLAAFQAPVILMSQNRQAEKDRENARRDYEVNLKAELEIMRLHEKIDALTESIQNRLQK